MRTLVPLPDTDFYLWQMLVQIASGAVEEGAWLLYVTERPSERLSALMDAQIAEMHVWPDWRQPGGPTYNPAMKAGLVGQYLAAHPQAVDEPHLIIDPDVIPTGRGLPSGQRGTLLGTDTDSYTGVDYLRSKGALDALCDLVGVSVEEVERWVPAIGSQYLTWGIPGEWWSEVERLSVPAYHLLLNLNVPVGQTPVQAWCAEMYVTHLMAVRDGYRPTASTDLSMVWAGDDVTGWDSSAFFHNAGVVEPNGRDFAKTEHQSSPWKSDIEVSEESASARYVELIHDTAKKFPHLVW